jgi:cytochrome d ubiquinol oxidase subunit I
VLVCLGTTISAFWILVDNSWMQTPAGFKIVTDANGVSKAQLTDFWQAVFNPSTLQRLFHTLAACWVVGAFFLMGISAWYVLRHRNSDVTAIALRLAVVVAFLGSGLMFVSGDLQTREVQANQPLKFAAMEGVFQTERGVALELIGLPPSQTGPAAVPPLAIPNGLSAMSDLDPNGVIKGLDQEPNTSLWPPVALTWMSFHLMVGLGVLMMLLMLFGAFCWWRRSLDSNVWWLRFAVLAIPLPIIAVELGWMTAEVGRQPWIVQGLMMTSKGVSPGVSATDVGISLLAILLVYALLFFLWIYALTKEIGRGPEAAPGKVADLAARVVAALPKAGPSKEGN